MSEEKAMEILEEKLESLKEENRKLQNELDEYKEIDFEEILKKARIFDKLKTSMVGLRNRLLEFEDEVQETTNQTENMSILNLIKEVMNKNEKKTKL